VNSRQLLEISRVRRLAADGSARYARIRAGLSLAEVGEAVGVSAATVCRWELGQRRPVGRAALAYARLLDGLSEDLSRCDRGEAL